MAKKATSPIPKRPNTRKKGGKKSTNSGLSWGSIALLLLIVTALVGLFLLQSKGAPTSKPNETPTSNTYVPKTKSSANSYADWLLPEPNPSDNEELLTHKAFSISYNPAYKNANWVAYQLEGNKLKGEKHKRADKFVPDPRMSKSHTSTSDYTRSGFDRGHLAPAADMAWSEVAMKESFYMTNVSPQLPAFNRGIWKQLEELTRRWAIKDSLLLIMTGPVLTPGLPEMGNTGIVIPEYFYKVVVDAVPPVRKAIAFVIPNEGSKSSLRSFTVSVDSVERLTGINFMEAMPDELENWLEGNYDTNAWTW